MSQVNFPQLVPCFDLKYNYKITASAMVVSHDLSNTSLLPFLRLDLLSNLVLHMSNLPDTVFAELVLGLAV
jgi:hypothetical protein